MNRLAFLIVFVSTLAWADSRTVPADIFQVNVLGDTVDIKATSLGSSYSLNLPANEPASANSCLISDTSGNFSWLPAATADTASTLVERDSSGNFSAGTITAALSGNATNVTGVVATANMAGPANATTSGYISSTDWAAFNTAATAAKGNLTDATSPSVLTFSGATGAVNGGGTTITVSKAGAAGNGYLSSTDWGTFNNKVNSTAGLLNSYLDYTEIATPSNPSSGVLRLYSKSGDSLYTLNSAGTETQVGSGSGQKNYLQAGANTATGWTASGAGITVATDTTAADLPRDLTTKTGIKFTGVSGSTAFGYYDFTLDPADYGVKQQLQFAMACGLSGGQTCAASDFAAAVYSCTSAWSSGACGGTSTRLPLTPTDSSAVSALPLFTGTWWTTFDAPGSAAPYLQLQIGLNSSNTHALVISDVSVGPGVTVQGASISGWTAYTPGLTNITIGNGTLTGAWRQVGDSMEIVTDLIFGSTTSVSGTIAFGIPSGYTVNTTVVTHAGNTTWGNCQGTKSGTGYYVGSVLPNSATFNCGGGSAAADWNATVPWTMGTSDEISSKFTVPINQFAGQGTVALGQNLPAYYSGVSNSAGNWVATGTLSAVIGQAGSLCGANTISGTNTQYTITPSIPIPVGAKPYLEFSSDQTHWFPTGGYNGTFIVENLRYDGTNYFGASVAQNTSGQLLVTFGKYTAGTSNTWATTIYWRVTVPYPGAAVGFGIVIPGQSAGLVPSTGLPGDATGNAIPAGTVGETITTNTNSPSGGNCTTGSFATIASASLTAGIWSLTGGCYVVNATTTSEVQLKLQYNGSGGSNYGQDFAAWVPGAAVNGESLTMPLGTVVVNNSGAHSAIVTCEATTAAATAYCYVQGVRIH